MAQKFSVNKLGGFTINARSLGDGKSNRFLDFNLRKVLGSILIKDDEDRLMMMGSDFNESDYPELEALRIETDNPDKFYLSTLTFDITGNNVVFLVAFVEGKLAIGTSEQDYDVITEYFHHVDEKIQIVASKNFRKLLLSITKLIIKAFSELSDILSNINPRLVPQLSGVEVSQLQPFAKLYLLIGNYLGLSIDPMLAFIPIFSGDLRCLRSLWQNSLHMELTIQDRYKRSQAVITMVPPDENILSLVDLVGNKYNKSNVTIKLIAGDGYFVRYKPVIFGSYQMDVAKVEYNTTGVSGLSEIDALLSQLN